VTKTKLANAYDFLHR